MGANNRSEFFLLDTEGPDCPECKMGTGSPVLFVSKDGRTATFTFSVVADQFQLHVAYGIVAPSLRRQRDGWKGEYANDVEERVIEIASLGDMVRILAWVINDEGKELG